MEIKKIYDQLAAIEDRHWWFEYRQSLVKAVLGKHAPGKKWTTALDVGCGTGGNVSYFGPLCDNVIGFDKSEYAIELARKKNPDKRFINGDANEISKYFQTDSLDLVTIFNVLYHKWILSETEVLKQIRGLLKENGFLLVTEPAFKTLFRMHDVMDLAARRYSLGEMRILLEKSGFTWIFGTYFNSISFLPAYVLAVMCKLKRIKTLENIDQEINEMKTPPVLLNKIILNVLALERFWIGSVGVMPLGCSLLCLVKK